MYSRLHNRLGTAGFAVAIVALVAAVAGTAFAATGLNGKQKKEVKKIAKSVVKQGPAGAAGAAGLNGAAGPQGAPWTAGGTLPSGQTETGAWGMSFTAFSGAASISFPIPLAAPLDAQHVKKVNIGKSIPPECDNGSGEPSSGANPEADPGFLCVYATHFDNGGEIVGGQPIDPTTFSTGAAKTGAGLLLESPVESDLGMGTFAVTAP